jgi:CRP-like cAMP-binding protein
MMSHHRENHLLARLDRATFACIEKYLTIVRLKQGHVINETHATVQNVYFPLGGIISCVVELVDGGAIETGMIGKDGQFGAGPALDHKVSLNHVVMQVEGEVSVIESGRFRQLTLDHRALRELVVCYEQFFLGQVQQTAACNATHNVPMRTCKWLLRMRDLVGEDLPLTQEFLAQMMGVQRTSVSDVAGKLQEAGMIIYKRGHIHLQDHAKIEAKACECAVTVRSHYDRVFPNTSRPNPSSSSPFS